MQHKMPLRMRRGHRPPQESSVRGEKSSSPIVSALDNVMRMSGNCDSQRSCHAASQCQQTLSEPIAGLAYRQEKSSLTPFFRFFPGVHPALLTTRAAYRLHESPLLRIYESQLWGRSRSHQEPDRIDHRIPNRLTQSCSPTQPAHHLSKLWRSP